MTWVAFLISLFTTSFLVPNILLISIRKSLLDVPNGRKVHRGISSRLGGVAFFPSIFFSVGLSVGIYSLLGVVNPRAVMTIDFVLGMCGCMSLYMIGLADDIVGVSYRVKFLFQVFAATLVVLPGGWINDLEGIMGIHEVPAWVGMPLTVFLLVFVVNAVNLIDGIDGLASGLCGVALFFLGVVLAGGGEQGDSLLAFATLGTLVPFFYYNVFGIAKRKYKIFMGDTGSLVIGFVVGMLAIHASGLEQDAVRWAGGSPLLIAVSVLLVPCFDVVRVVLHRWREGKPLFLPDKNHIHHKFLALGLSHRRTMLLILGIACTFTVVNLVLGRYLNINVVLLLDVAAWTLFHVWLTWRVKVAKRKVVGEETGWDNGMNYKQLDELRLKVYLERNAGREVSIDSIKAKSGVEPLRVDSLLREMAEEGKIVVEGGGEEAGEVPTSAWYEGKTQIQWFEPELPDEVERFLIRYLRR